METRRGRQYTVPADPHRCRGLVQVVGLGSVRCEFRARYDGGKKCWHHAEETKEARLARAARRRDRRT